MRVLTTRSGGTSRAAGSRLLVWIALVSILGGLAAVTADGLAASGAATTSRVGPVSRRLLRFLNATGPAAFRLAAGRTTAKVTKPSALKDALRHARWRPAAATGISLVRLEHRTGNIPAGTLAWLVSVKPRAPVYDSRRLPAANYFVVVISARNGRLLGDEDGYSRGLDPRGRASWATAEWA